jgi:hypothetical protein
LAKMAAMRCASSYAVRDGTSDETPFQKTCMQGALEARPGRASLTSLLLSRRARLLPTLDHAAIADGIFSSVYGCPLEACTGVRRFVSVSTPPAFRHFRIEPLPQFTARICGRCARRGWCNGDYCSQTPDRAVCDDGMRVQGRSRQGPLAHHGSVLGAAG